MNKEYRRERIDRGIKARTKDIFALSSYREILYLMMPRVLPVIILLSLPLILGSGYWGRVLIYACVFGLLALSWDFLAAAGMISLGQAFFFGTGSYIAGILNLNFGLPFYITIPLGTIGGALVSTLFLAPVLRLRGIYFAMVTFIFPMAMARIIHIADIFGGQHGLPGITPLPNLWVAMYLAVVALLACLFIFRRIINQDYGLVMQGIRDNDRAVMSGGINIYWYKAQAVFFAAAVCSFAGAFMAHYFRFIGPSAFAMDYSILPVAGVILGGPGSFAGAVLGTSILVPLSELLRAFGPLRIVFYCVVLAASVLALPEGVFHYIQRRYHQFERIVEV